MSAAQDKCALVMAGGTGGQIQRQGGHSGQDKEGRTVFHSDAKMHHKNGKNRKKRKNLRIFAGPIVQNYGPEMRYRRTSERWEVHLVQLYQLR